MASEQCHSGVIASPITSEKVLGYNIESLNSHRKETASLLPCTDFLLKYPGEHPPPRSLLRGMQTMRSGTLCPMSADYLKFRWEQLWRKVQNTILLKVTKISFLFSHLLFFILPSLIQKDIDVSLFLVYTCNPLDCELPKTKNQYFLIPW